MLAAQAHAAAYCALYVTVGRTGRVISRSGLGCKHTYVLCKKGVRLAMVEPIALYEMFIRLALLSEGSVASCHGMQERLQFFYNKPLLQ